MGVPCLTAHLLDPDYYSSLAKISKFQFHFSFEFTILLEHNYYNNINISAVENWALQGQFHLWTWVNLFHKFIFNNLLKRLIELDTGFDKINI